jgi:hypothetical protein
MSMDNAPCASIELPLSSSESMTIILRLRVSLLRVSTGEYRSRDQLTGGAAGASNSLIDYSQVSHIGKSLQTGP